MMSLRVVIRHVTGKLAPLSPPPMNETVAVSAAADLFEQLRASVSARYPSVFVHPTAA